MKFLSSSHARASSLSPGRIALGYAVVATLWIVFSDAAVTRLHLPPGTETIKGAFFVVVTAALLYFTVRRLVQALERTSEARREQAELLDLTHDTVLVMDTAGAIQYWNRGAEEQYGWSAEQALGRVVHDLLKTVFPMSMEQIKAEVMRAGRWEGELLHTRRNGTQVVVASRWSLQRDQSGRPVAILETNNDITERKRAEESLRRLTRELAAISNCNQVLLRATDEQSLLKEICRIVCEEAGYRVVWVGYAEFDEAKNVRPVAWTGTAKETIENLGISWADTERGRGPCGTAIRTGKTTCIKDYAAEPREETWTGRALQSGLCSAIGLPLKDEQARTFGSLNIYSAQPNAFTPEEVRLLEELADDLAFGIVTLRSRAARQRAEQEVTLLTFALDNVHEAVFLMDEARLAYVNEAACRRLGYSREELLRLGVADIDPDFPVERWADHWRDLKAQQSLTFESRHRTREGRIFPVEISANYFEYGGRAYNLALARDITERKRAGDELRRTSSYLAETQRLTHTGTAVADPTTLPLYWSEEMFRIFGLDPQQGLPTREQPLERIHPEDREKFRQAFQRAIQDKVDADGEYRLVLPDGTVKHIYGLGHPVLNGRGELVEIVITVVDITDRKRAEEALRRSEAYLAEGQRLAQMGSWAWDPATYQALYWSAEMYRIYDLNPQNGLPTTETFWQRIHPEDRDRARKYLMRAVAEKRDYAHDLRIVLPDGTVKHIHAVGHPVHDKAGNLVEYFGTAMDVTERRRAEEALRRSESYLVEGQRLAHMGSWAWDPATRQSLYWSEEMFRIFDLDPRNGVPTAETFWQRIHPEDLERTRELLLKAAAGNMEYEHDHRIVLPDGTIKHIHAVGHPVLDEHGKVIEYVGTAIDVTERKRAEDELRKHREHLEELVKQRTDQLAEAKARAEDANRAKSTFLANMSHELRTPLNAVLGFSRLLKNDPNLTPPQQETLDVIVRSGEHLLNLINNVLDMAKIESGRVVLKESEVDLPRLLHEMQSLLGVGAVEKGLRFAVEHDPDLPRFTAVDADKLRQVLLNLLGNAIKHTESGGVKLRARLANLRGAEKATVRFEVEDSGPGISAEDCRRIFTPFVQVGQQSSAQTGTGLGLAICKQYVELMGGQIGVNSQPGKGSVFHFEIPVTILESVAEHDELKHPRVLGLADGQPRHRLLIVEDQPENRLLLRRILTPFGFEMREAVNGQEAVTLFEQWHPDLIWMDIRMPVMDGLEAVRRIRATPAGAQTKIVALTAHALEEERDPIMAAGCDDLVRKPFQEHELFGALARHLRLKFIYETTPRPKPTPEPSELSVQPEQLNALPAELRQELRQAVIELDTARTQALIEQVSQRDAALGRSLNTLASRLDFKRLLKLLETDHPETGPMI